MSGELRGRPVLVATEGSAAAAAAARVAAALAAERGAVPHALRVHDTRPVGLPPLLPGALAVADELIGADVHEPEVRATRAELAALTGGAADWRVHVAIGTPAKVIVRAAGNIGAALIVMGLRRHGGVDRVLHDETTLNVMRHASCPVLGVTPALTDLPRRAVVGVDFGHGSLYAARAAASVLRTEGTLVLAYVEPSEGEPGPPDDGHGHARREDVASASGIEAAFQRFIRDLAAPARLTVERAHVRDGSGRTIAERLLIASDQHGADLIAVSARRHGWLDRTLLRGVTVDLARDGRCSLLVVPPPAGAADPAD